MVQNILLFTFDHQPIHPPKMKLKPINIAEIAAALLFIAGMVLKPAYVPYAGLIAVLSGGILSMLYFYFGIYTLRSSGVQQGNLIIYGILFGIAVIALILGFQHWPLAKIYLITAIGAFFTVAIWRILAAYLLNRTEILAYSKGIAIRYLVLLITMVFIFLSLHLTNTTKTSAYESHSRSYPATIHR